MKLENHRRQSGILAACKRRRAVLRPVIMSAVLAGFLSGSVAPLTAQDKLSKFLLLKLARDQYTVLCQTPEFTQCMGFDQARCTELSEGAINQCLMPLPDTIDPAKLDNDTLESCPQKFYADAGYSEEKALGCFGEAMRANQSQ